MADNASTGETKHEGHGHLRPVVGESLRIHSRGNATNNFAMSRVFQMLARSLFVALLPCLSVGDSLAGEPTVFELPDWRPMPAARTPWTRWSNTFDFRRGAGDPDFYVGSGFRPSHRPSNYRSMEEGRFGYGAPLYRVNGKRTQMMATMRENCPVYQATVEMFVRSQSGKNIWSDGAEHHVFHFYGPRAARLKGTPSVSLIKTKDNTLVYQCQGTTLELPVEELVAEEWYHIAVSWDTTQSPGRLWLTINGKGATVESTQRMQAVAYECLLIGNSPRETERVFERNFGDWAANWRRLWIDEPGDTDVFPLEGVVDEIRISDETLADRTIERRRKLDELPIDWELYAKVEDRVRLYLYRAWPNMLPLTTRLGGKYGGAASAGWLHNWMHEAYGDVWFLDQAERVGRIALMAQQPEGHFPTAIKMFAGNVNSHDLRYAETGIERVGLAEWSKPEHARIQDGFQDGLMCFLVYLYRLTGDDRYLHPARRVADLLVEAQNPNGSWSGLYNVKTRKGNIADNPAVLQGGEFDDGGIRRPFWALLLMYHVTGDEKYLAPLRDCADWILDAEIVGSNARGWAGFYDAQNRPVVARSHEHAKIMTQVLPKDVGHLMIWTANLFDDPRYVLRLQPALTFYQTQRDPKRGWPGYFENDGRPFTPSDNYSRIGWYGPLFGHFEDIRYIEEAVQRLNDDKSLRPASVPLEPTDSSLAAARARALERLQDPDFLRWVRRDVDLVTKAEWVPNRPRLEPDLYGLQVGGHARIDLLTEYLLLARIVAGKVPARVALGGARMPDGVMVTGLHQRCWFVEDWFDTPLSTSAD